MPVKALAISALAALVGPTVGVGVFLLANGANGDRFAGQTALPVQAAPPVTKFDYAEVMRTFAEPRLWPGPKSTVMPERREIGATELSPELAAWRTVVGCPDGQPLPETGRCPAPDWPRPTGKHSTAELTADTLGSGEIEKPQRTPYPLPGRMSLSKSP